jgi:hypothetical protein
MYNTAFLKIRRSKVLPNNSLPKDDVVKWLHIELENKVRYTIVYRIIDEKQAKYNSFFQINVSYFRTDILKDLIIPNKLYKVFRGPEEIGIFKIKTPINENAETLGVN